MQNETRKKLAELIKVLYEAPEKSCPYPDSKPECEICEFGVEPLGCNSYERYAEYLIRNGVVMLDTAIISPKNRPLIQTFAEMPIDEVLNLVRAKQEGKIVALHCKIGDLVDKLFSHNETVAIWENKLNENCHRLLWKGMGWNIPKEYKELSFSKIFGTVPESITEADTINIEVTIDSVTPRLKKLYEKFMSKGMN